MGKRGGDNATTIVLERLRSIYDRGGPKEGEGFHLDTAYALVNSLPAWVIVPGDIYASIRCAIQTHRAGNTKGLGGGRWHFDIAAVNCNQDSACGIAKSVQSQPDRIIKQETINVPNITHKTMTWKADEIRALPAIKFNRDVDRHAKQLVARGIDRNSPVYSTGFATVFVRKLNKTYKLNGNTRSYLDATDQVALPDVLSGDHYECDTMDEALELYDKIDNPGNVKQAVDRLFTAIKFNNIRPKAPLFERGGGTSGIAVSYNALHGRESNSAPNMVEAVGDLRLHLIAVDGVLAECEVTSNRIATHAAVIAAMVLTRAKTLHGIPKPDAREIAHNDWAEYWCSFHQSKGKLLGTGTSPFNAAWEVVQDMIRGSQRKELFKMCGKLLDCFDRRENDRITSVHKLKIAEYIPMWEDLGMVEGDGVDIKKGKSGKSADDARPTA